MMNFKLCSFVALVAISGAVYANPAIEMARQAGFTGCESKITEELKNFNSAGSARIQADSPNERELKDKVISYLVTFGSPGDGVLQKITFINHAGLCQSFGFAQITNVNSCAKYLKENPVWKHVETQGDSTWVHNQRGVIGVMKNSPGGGCIISFNRGG